MGMLLARLGIAAALLLTSSGAVEAQETAETQADGSAFIPAPMNPAADGAVSGINHFTLDLFKRMGQPNDNLFLSPASVSTAMALAYRGARGVTADELRRVLYFSAPPETYLSVQAPILRAMTFSATGRELSTNNSLWVQDGLSLNPAYLADTAANAGAGLWQVDYRADPDRARVTINQWVSDKTHDRINNLLSPEDVTNKTRAILVNTIYWKGHWETAFPIAATKTQPFHLLDGETIPALLMHQEAGYQVLERNGVKAIDLPYRGGEVSMTVLMPNRAGGLPAFEAGLTDATLTRWLAALDASEARPTIVTLPKMHLEWSGDLVGAFKALGVSAAFDARADFYGMAAVPSDQVLAIGHIIHQTWLDVDEEVSEAAAATAVVEDVIVTRLLNPPKPKPPFVFRADKPFLFLLRDRRTHAILFIGRYTGPTKAS
jgi:serpin B